MKGQKCVEVEIGSDLYIGKLISGDSDADICLQDSRSDFCAWSIFSSSMVIVIPARITEAYLY